MTPLQEITLILELHLAPLEAAFSAFNLKVALKKHVESRLIRDAEGKSHAEKLTRAYASDEWRDFSLELAELENRYQQERLKHEVLKADYQTKYLMHKESEEQIKRYR